MRLTSADGKWWWNGHAWQPLPQPAEAAVSLDAGADSAMPPPASEPAAVVPPAAEGPRFMPGRYVKSNVSAPGHGVARRLYDLSRGRINMGPSQAALPHARLLDEEIGRASCRERV